MCHGKRHVKDAVYHDETTIGKDERLQGKARDAQTCRPDGKRARQKEQRAQHQIGAANARGRLLVDHKPTQYLRYGVGDEQKHDDKHARGTQTQEEGDLQQPGGDGVRKPTASRLPSARANATALAIGAKDNDGDEMCNARDKFVPSNPADRLLGGTDGLFHDVEMATRVRIHGERHVCMEHGQFGGLLKGKGGGNAVNNEGNGVQTREERLLFVRVHVFWWKESFYR